MSKAHTRNAVERLRDRMSARFDAEHDVPRNLRKTQRKLAEQIGISEGSFSDLLNGPASKRGLLAYLDTIADYFGLPPSLLVHRNDTALMELQPGEYRVLQHWRRLSADVQESIMMLFDYFAGLLPEEKETHRIGVLWSKLTAAERENLERTIREQIRGRRTRPVEGTAAAAPPSSPETPEATEPQGRRRRR